MAQKCLLEVRGSLRATHYYNRKIFHTFYNSRKKVVMVFYYAVLLHNKFFEGTFGASSHHQSTQVSTLLVCEDSTDIDCLYILW